MHDILEESWAYQEIIGKGLLQGEQRGEQRGYQQAAITMVVTRFADLEELVKTKITAIVDVERLQQLIVDLSISHTREQMERVLLSLSTDA